MFSAIFFLTMRRLNLLRVTKEIEIIGMDISELGGVSEDVYAKLRKDFGLFSPLGSPSQSTYVRTQARQSVNRPYASDDDDDEGSQAEQRLVITQKLLEVKHERKKLDF